MNNEAESSEAAQCSFVSIHYIICECGKTFPSETDLKNHLEKEHPQKRERKEYKCGVCGDVYPTEDACIQHYEDTHIVNETLDPDAVEYDDDQKDEDYEQKLQVEELTEFIFDEDDMIKHEYEDEEVPAAATYIIEGEEGEAPTLEVLEEEEVPQPAPGALFEIPTFTLTEKKTRRRRRPKLEGEPLKPDHEMLLLVNPQRSSSDCKFLARLRKTETLPRNVRDIVCEVCGKAYASRAALRYHQRTHTGERPYKCEICPKAFTMPLFLQIHIRTHTGERPFECKLCPKAFSNKAAIMRHDRVHTGEKPYACPMCSKRFSQSNSMKLHVTTVHLKQPTPYKSRNRKRLCEERGESKVNPRKRPPITINSLDVLRNGLESYVLGPLKTQMETLKNDIELLARGGDLAITTDNPSDKQRGQRWVVTRNTSVVSDDGEHPAEEIKSEEIAERGPRWVVTRETSVVSDDGEHPTEETNTEEYPEGTCFEVVESELVYEEDDKDYGDVIYQEV